MCLGHTLEERNGICLLCLKCLCLMLWFRQSGIVGKIKLLTKPVTSFFFNFDSFRINDVCGEIDIHQRNEPFLNSTRKWGYKRLSFTLNCDKHHTCLKGFFFLSINIRQVDGYHDFKWQILKDFESKNKNVSMQIIHLSKVNKTDLDLYFYVDTDQSTGSFILGQ